jgi:RHS repeat-associated protein
VLHLLHLYILSDSHFTGKERDTESGNDYFGARYYDSSMGRFMSPDWSAPAEAVPYADLHDPQSLNLYSYVKNNPLSKSDPDGHCDVDGEHHWGWCIWHDLGLYQTQVDKVNEARSFFTNNQVTQNGTQVDPSKLNDKQVLQAFQNFNADWAKIAGTGADPYAVMASVPVVFRGGTNLQVRSGLDVKPDANGMIQPGRGVSVNADASRSSAELMKSSQFPQN